MVCLSLPFLSPRCAAPFSTGSWWPCPPGPSTFWQPVHPSGNPCTLLATRAPFWQPWCVCPCLSFPPVVQLLFLPAPGGRGSPLGLRICYWIAPDLLVLLSHMQGCNSQSSAQQLAAQRFYILLLCNVFFAYLITDTIVNTIVVCTQAQE